MEVIFNPCGEFRRSPEDPVSQIDSPHLLVGAPGIFSDLLTLIVPMAWEIGYTKPCIKCQGKTPTHFVYF